MKNIKNKQEKPIQNYIEFEIKKNGVANYWARKTLSPDDAAIACQSNYKQLKNITFKNL